MKSDDILFFKYQGEKIIFLQSCNIFESVVFFLWGWWEECSQFPSLVQSLKEEYALFCRIPRPWINDLQVGLPGDCNIPNTIINAFVSFSYNSAELIFHLHPTNPRRWPSYPRLTRGLPVLRASLGSGFPSTVSFLPSQIDISKPYTRMGEIRQMLARLSLAFFPSP